MSEELSFQEYFVKEKCSPKVLAVQYQGAETAAANPQCIEAIKNADMNKLIPKVFEISSTTITRL